MGGRQSRGGSVSSAARPSRSFRDEDSADSSLTDAAASEGGSRRRCRRERSERVRFYARKIGLVADRSLETMALIFRYAEATQTRGSTSLRGSWWTEAGSWSTERWTAARVASTS